ncbi:MAG: hypothetical protein IAG13_27280 [Deltaproteobacteria bacterium]|nr:hypothetical protein [Nannocystaceae bacterium]
MSRRRDPDSPYIRSTQVAPEDLLPDARDGLNRVERVILYTLSELQKERGERNVPTVMLYGRVVERIDISVDELQRVLQRMIGVR